MCGITIEKTKYNDHCKYLHASGCVKYIRKMQAQLDLQNYDLVSPSCGKSVNRKDLSSHNDVCEKNSIPNDAT